MRIFQAPPLPAYFVERPEVSRSLKASLLLERAKPGTLIISALHGLGGVGKSTLAAALARDSEVLARFSDGVLWATLGQQPDLLPLLSGWIQALGDRNFHPISVEAASSHLRSLLRERAVLIVVDDAWDAGDARKFQVGGPSCLVLITTREALVAKAFGARQYDLDAMTAQQALALMSGRLGRELNKQEQESAFTLAKF